MKKHLLIETILLVALCQTLLASNITASTILKQQQKQFNYQTNETALEKKIRAQHSLKEKKLEYEKQLTQKLKKRK
jgi:hypothetical protein